VASQNQIANRTGHSPMIEMIYLTYHMAPFVLLQRAQPDRRQSRGPVMGKPGLPGDKSEPETQKGNFQNCRATWQKGELIFKCRLLEVPISTRIRSELMSPSFTGARLFMATAGARYDGSWSVRNPGSINTAVCAIVSKIARISTSHVSSWGVL
jgi:hypothetical protein